MANFVDNRLCGNVAKGGPTRKATLKTYGHASNHGFKCIVPMLESDAVKPWILRVLPEEVFALRSGKGADDMAMDVSSLLENAEVNDECCAGLSYDFAKCYDHVIPAMAIDTLMYRGAPLSVLQGLRGFYHQHCKRFKLGCAFSEAYKPSNGIIQGDPLSNFILARLIACWLEKLSHGNFGRAPVSIKPRVYVDDISAAVVAADLDSFENIYNSLTPPFRDLHS